MWCYLGIDIEIERVDVSALDACIKDRVKAWISRVLKAVMPMINNNFLSECIYLIFKTI